MLTFIHETVNRDGALLVKPRTKVYIFPSVKAGHIPGSVRLMLDLGAPPGLVDNALYWVAFFCGGYDRQRLYYV